jgi:hypothetical protein
MMRLASLSAMLFMAVGAVSAQEAGLGKSIMFDNQQERSDLTTLPPSQTEDRGDKCMDMMHEVERLKGHPQRRSVAMDRYKRECELR